MEKSPAKVALLGLGGFGSVYCDNLFKNAVLQEEAQLCAAVDPFAETCKWYPELQKRSIPVYKDLDSLFAAMHPDLCCIATPIQFHKSQTIRCLQEGCGVLLEKPFSGCSDDCREIIAARDATDSYLSIGFQWCSDPVMRKAKADRDAGLFGAPLACKAIVLWPRDEAYYKRGIGWAGRRYAKDGTAIFDSVASNATAHYLFNMLWFYWFGNIFLQYFTPKQMGGLYLLGGLAGALFYVAAYNIFPYFADKQSMMCGASAAIMAVVLAITVRIPDYKVNLLFLGSVSLKYIAAVTVFIDLFSMTSANAGGHIAHIGGAVMGILFAVFWKRGKDLTRPINAFVDIIFTFFSRPRFKVRRPRYTKSSGSTTSGGRRRPESDYEYNARKKREMDEIDAILDKIKKSGYSALTEAEKKRLFDAGKPN